MLTILSFIVGVLGAAMLSYSAWLVFPAAGYATAGALCLFWSYLTSKRGN